MPEIIKKVGNGYIFYCPGCKELHYVDETFGFYGTLEIPSFLDCLIITKEPIPEYTEKDVHGHKIIRPTLIECQSSIHGGVLFFWPREKHKLNGYYEMAPLDSGPDIIPNYLGYWSTDLPSNIQRRYDDSIKQARRMSLPSGANNG